MNKNSKQRHSTLQPRVSRIGRLLLSGMLLGSLLAVPTVQASQFGLRVLDIHGMPVEGASVCFGLPGNYRQFGASFTDKQGVAVMDVPNVPLVVTVSKTRFSGTRLSEPARGFNLIKDVTLQEGLPGPRCRAGSTMADVSSSIKVDRVDVIEAADAKQLKLAVSGNPSHYRLSVTDAFGESNWQPFDSHIELPDYLSDHARIFLQMRRFQDSGDSWLEARSPVVQVLLR